MANNDFRSSFDKFKDDLFEYRIDIKSYKRNLNTIIISGSILISVFAFFGYNKIDSIQESILKKANERLAITDSLLANINENKIDSLNKIIAQKEIEYKETIENFESIISENKALENKLLNSLPENKRSNLRVNSFRTEFPTSIFEIRPFRKTLRLGQNESIFLIFKEEIDNSKEDFISISLYPKGRNVLLMDKAYVVDSRLNRLTFGIEKFEEYKDYTLEICYFKKETSGEYRNYYIKENIKLKE
jgi:chorismate mutase